jgi:hypothetical protein
VWTYYEGVSVLVNESSGIPFRYILKIPIVLADVGIIWLLMRILKDKVMVLWYAWNPLVLYIGAGESAFDSIVMFFLLLSFYSYSKKTVWSGIWLSLSIMMKTYTILLLPVFLWKLKTWSKRFKFGLAAGLPFLVIMLPVLIREFEPTKGTYLSYAGTSDYGWLAIVKSLFALGYGTSINLSPFSQWEDSLLDISKYMFLAVYVWLLWILWKRKYRLPVGIILIFLLFYIIMGGVATQYLSWVIPFLLIMGTKEIVAYTILSTVAMVTYLLGQFYEPVLKHYDFFLFQSPGLFNAFYLISLLVFWFYIFRLFFRIREEAIANEK